MGIYNKQKESLYNGNILKLHNDYKYEICEFPIYMNYSIINESLVVDSVKFPLKKKYKTIVGRNNHVFICYDKVLEVYELDGTLYKRILSEENILAGSGGFLVLDRVHYIFNFYCDAIFVDAKPEVLDFGTNGDIVFFKNGNLSIKSKNKETVYDCNTDIVKQMGEIEVYRDSVKIEDIVCCRSLMLYSLEGNGNPELALSKNQAGDGQVPNWFNCFIILCKNCVFLIYKDIIVKKRLALELSNLIPERFIAHNFVDQVDFYDCILALSCYENIFLYKSDGVERFIMLLMQASDLNNNEKLIDKFFLGLKKSLPDLEPDARLDKKNSGCLRYTTILCRTFRQVDDRAKDFIDKFIDYSNIHVDDMFYLIIYKPDLTEKFILLCKGMDRLFYLDDLVCFFDKTNQSDKLKMLFLKNDLLIYKYKGLDRLYEIEREEVMAQRACYLDFHNSRF